MSPSSSWPLARRNAMMQRQLLMQTAAQSGQTEKAVTLSAEEIDELQATIRKHDADIAALKEGLPSLATDDELNAVRDIAQRKAERVPLGSVEIEVGGIVAIGGPKPFKKACPGLKVGDIIEIVPPATPDDYLFGIPKCLKDGELSLTVYTPALTLLVKYKWTITVFAIR